MSRVIEYTAAAIPAATVVYLPEVLRAIVNLTQIIHRVIA